MLSCKLALPDPSGQVFEFFVFRHHFKHLTCAANDCILLTQLLHFGVGSRKKELKPDPLPLRHLRDPLPELGQFNKINTKAVLVKKFSAIQQLERMSELFGWQLRQAGAQQGE